MITLDAPAFSSNSFLKGFSPGHGNRERSVQRMRQQGDRKIVVAVGCRHGQAKGRADHQQDKKAYRVPRTSTPFPDTNAPSQSSSTRKIHMVTPDNWTDRDNSEPNIKPTRSPLFASQSIDDSQGANLSPASGGDVHRHASDDASDRPPTISAGFAMISRKARIEPFSRLPVRLAACRCRADIPCRNCSATTWRTALSFVRVNRVDALRHLTAFLDTTEFRK